MEEKSKFVEIVSLTATVGFLVLFPPILLFVLLPLYGIRLAVSFIGPILNPKFVQIATFRTSIWCEDALSEKPLGTTAAICVFDSPLTMQEMTIGFTKKILGKKSSYGNEMYTEMKMHIEKFLSYSFWVKDSPFDQNDHYESLREEIIYDDQLVQITDEMERAKWPIGKSPWKVVLVPNYCERNKENITKKSAILFLCHHSIADARGVQAVLLNELTDYKEINIKERDGFKFNTIFKQVYDGVKDNVFLNDKNGFRIGENNLIKKRDLYYSQELIERSEIEKIVKKNKVTSLGVQAAAIAGGLRKYMKSQNMEIPEILSLMFPFSHEDHNDELSNYHTYVNLRLPVGEIDREKRLQLSNIDFETQMKSLNAETYLSILKLVGGLPGFLIKMLFRVESVTGTFVTLSGPSSPVYYKGKQLVDIRHFNGPLPGSHGLYFLMAEYCGKIRIGAGMSQSFSPNGLNAKYLTKLVFEEFYELRKI